MGTFIEITAQGTDAKKMNRAVEGAFAEIKRIERLMSEREKGSELSRINQNSGKKAVKVSQEMLGVIIRSIHFSEISRGAFDISWAALAGLWDFDRKKSIPPKEKINNALKLVDYRNIAVDRKNSTVFLQVEGMRIGLGGIAKGYAVDRAIQVLQQEGIQDAIVNAGGDLRVIGEKDGQPWRVGIQDPREKDKLLGVLEITDTSFASSGDYERYFIKDGVRYHHILNPKTGFPAQGCRSVTIICPSALEADALATAVFVLGPAAGLKLIEDLAGVETLIIDHEGKIIMSEGMKEKIKLL
ncbi:MAG: FAD:protein FMN transferase [Deltaproteobacteria bacterium]|nr:MAG: FAD:protein FMN transferase [Deltaproteobacteria bacterium]